MNSRTKKKSKKYDLDDLRYLMRRLRDPETGCPWDLKQTFQTIAPFTLEEVFEVVDTIEREDYAHLKEELGDLLFQVIFYAQLGEEEARFNFDDIVSGLVEKLVLRHPHVFPAGTLHSYREGSDMQKPSAIKETWEAIKQSERKEKGRDSVLADIPVALPALMRAAKIQKRAANHGFDWPSVEGAVEKLDEEIDELKQVLSAASADKLLDELGDVLFSAVNICRHCGIDAETALRSTVRKFERRFQYIESRAEASGRELEDLGLMEMDLLWEQAKSEP